jgi:hypothetical protein
MTDTPYLTSQARRGRSMVVALLALGTLGTAACSDNAAPLAPRAAAPAPSLSLVSSTGVTSRVLVGDTTITTFTLQPLTRPDAFQLGNGNRIQFPNGASSVCDILTSSYGPGTWDAPCVPSLLPVTITARTWTDARGLSHSDFQPAMRFVPSHNVQLAMRNRDGLLSASMRVDFCTATGCVNEAKADPSLLTVLNGAAGTATRRIKHFSGYMVTVGITDNDGNDSTQTDPNNGGW